MTQETDDLITSIKEEKDIFSKSSQIDNLIEEKNFRIVEIAKKLGVTSAYICHLLRLNKLPEIIVDGYYSKSINISHLFVLSRINNHDKMLTVYEEILKNNLTVVQTEELVRENLYGIKTKGSYLQLKEKEQLIKKFREKYPQANIRITQSRIKGKIIIEIGGDLDETSRIISEITNQLVIR